MTSVLEVLLVLSLAVAFFLYRRSQRMAGEVLRAQSDSRRSIEESQVLVDQQIAEMRQEAERIRQHYEAESRKIRDEADAAAAKVRTELEPLRKFQAVRDAEAEAQRLLTQALN